MLMLILVRAAFRGMRHATKTTLGLKLSKITNEKGSLADSVMLRQPIHQNTNLILNLICHFVQCPFGWLWIYRGGEDVVIEPGD